MLHTAHTKIEKFSTFPSFSQLKSERSTETLSGWQRQQHSTGKPIPLPALLCRSEKDSLEFGFEFWACWLMKSQEVKFYGSHKS